MSYTTVTVTLLIVRRLDKDALNYQVQLNAQCNDHRTGSACGECNSPGYTLSYDSTDCISVDHCSVGMTVLVVVLTCLYWIVVVVGVFSLMYFNFQISSGYVYGIIYYYSVVGILLDNNPYVSNGAFQFISVLSSFAQLSPQFLGKLCFVKGLSGIDQLFIHYSHAVAVSLLTLLIVLAARCSVRITVFVSRLGLGNITIKCEYRQTSVCTIFSPRKYVLHCAILITANNNVDCYCALWLINFFIFYCIKFVYLPKIHCLQTILFYP